MFEMRPYHNNRRNHMAVSNPFRELDEFERSFFTNPFGFFGGDTLAAFRTRRICRASTRRIFTSTSTMTC